MASSYPRGSEMAHIKFSAAGSICVEQFDDRRRKARELVECGNDWLSNSEQRFVERYMAGDINIGLRRASRDEPQYGFIINRCDKRNWFEAETRGPSDGYRTGVYINGKQPSVVSNDIQLAESPERWIHSLIRFQVFDKAAFVLGKCLYEFGSLVPTFSDKPPNRKRWETEFVHPQLRRNGVPATRREYRGCFGWR
jgi:hypothetical protein